MKSKCNCAVMHIGAIERAKKSLPSEEELNSLAEIFKIFSEPTRIGILSALTNEKMCVCDIAHLLDMTHSAISHQMRVLKQARLVKGEKIGKLVYYSLIDEHIEMIMHVGLRHVTNC